MNPSIKLFLFLAFLCFELAFLSAQDKKEQAPAALTWRALGPAMNSGRIADIAINPHNHDQWYIAAASGGVWKTDNHGNTFYPIFDQYGSYSIGCVSIDPKNPNVVWLGTGENNNQRSVAYGDGVYKSVDGGKSWKKMGLDKSEHIGNIVIHPDNSDRVFVSAYGPLWSSGGDRGLYRTNDGGQTWDKILEVDEHTGINEFHIDPNDGNIMYATAHQRRRHVWTYISGGPASAIYKSTDAGETWRKLTNGIPKNDLGRISISAAPSQAGLVYAMIEADKKSGGVYRSEDYGESWKKTSDYQTSGNYYVEIYCDPYDADKVFSMDTWLHHSEDGGKTFKRTGEKSKHVDNHDIWIDPNNTDHWLVACDGGLYETWDHATNWHFKPNLPLTQFYKLAVDNDLPFYNVYGGTQDNNTIGGPSRTINNAGIANSDWYITKGGDGFKSQVDPEDPNIIYSQSQYGWLVRYDHKSGERISIKPMADRDEKGLRWNWDSPLLISPHSSKRLYFAANKLFRSDDRGDNWKAISDDLSRDLDRNELEVMDRIWEVDAVAKNRSTSEYGNITALDESPLKEDRLIVGTDDGLVHLSDDAGQNWRTTKNISGIPDMCYVNDARYSLHDENTVYLVFNNHKHGDFKPYLLKSTDNGRTWRNISGTLPERGSVYTIEEDHVDPDLLFCGTEFGAFYTADGGKNWTQLKQGMPTIAVRDLEIQRRENDLVAATFGRGFYVIDNYHLLRELDNKDDRAHIFDVKTALLYNESSPLGTRGNASQGESYFTTKNPPVGVSFDYHLDTVPPSIKQARNKKEKKLRKNKDKTVYPTKEEITAEDRERKKQLIFVVEDKEGNTINKIIKPAKQGIHRVVWNGRYASQSAIQLKERKPGRYSSRDWGALVPEGDYRVSMILQQHDDLDTLVLHKDFKVKHLNNNTIVLDQQSIAITEDFRSKTASLYRSIQGSTKLLSETDSKIKHLDKAIQTSPKLPMGWLDRVQEMQDKMWELKDLIYGNSSLRSRYYTTENSLIERAWYAYGNTINNRQKPTGTAMRMYEIASEDYSNIVQPILSKLVRDVERLEKEMDELGGPYTPGRDDSWKKE